jgi:hypothetical protein
MINLRLLEETRDRTYQHLLSIAKTQIRKGAKSFPNANPTICARIILLEFGCILLAWLGTGCGSLTITTPPLIPDTGLHPVGRWEIIPLDYKVFSSPNEGWKIVRICVALENKTFAFASPSIKTEGTKLFTDPTNAYAVETFRTSGALFSPTKEISFLTPIPMAYRIKGEYQNDAVVSYYFQAQIPENSKPAYLLIANSGAKVIIPENPNSSSFLRLEENIPLRKPGAEVNVAGKATLRLNKVERTAGWPPTHDKISARITLTNTNVMTNTKVALRFLPFDDTGIVGAPFEDKFDCQALLEVGPGKPKESKICALVPRTANKIHLVVAGDTYEVYEIWPPPK